MLFSLKYEIPFFVRQFYFQASTDTNFRNASLRPANRITYEVTIADTEPMLIDMQLFYQNGVDGYVFGPLKKDNVLDAIHRNIDIEHCNDVIRNSHNLPVTFHRAINMTDPAKKCDNLNVIERCGFKRVLSSGFAETAVMGIDHLLEMIQFAQNQCIIKPGCGISVDNVYEIFDKFQWRVKQQPEIIESYDSDYQKECLRNNPFYVTSEEIVRKLVECGKRYERRNISPTQTETV